MSNAAMTAVPCSVVERGLTLLCCGLRRLADVCEDMLLWIYETTEGENRNG